jgi:peptidoglycan/xylan/chitin deacetylase (PgdA/CDA1 family)
VSGVILLYHRVGDPPCDPFELAVSAEQFREQLGVLASFGPIRPLAELARDRNGGLAFAVTFDDGYADNLHVAKPILEDLGVPATVFVTTGTVGGEPFWWDALAELLHANAGAGTIELEPGTWSLAETGWEEVFYDVWARLQPLKAKPRNLLLRELRAQLPVEPVTGGGSVTLEELVELDRGELVTIGAHTLTHPMLSMLSAAQARREIVGSKDWLEDVLGRAVTTFSYPYGGPDHYGEAAVTIVGDAGFEAACSAVAGAVTSDSSRFELPRLPVERWDADGLERALGQLLGERPRRGRRVPARGRVDFGDLRRLEPISASYGFDRGRPIDRYYIERFVEERRDAIRGRVLEFGEPFYSRLHGDGDAETLDLDREDATYRCRLEDGSELPSDAFDCVVCTQVLQYVHDLRAGVQTLHRILRPGGTLLLTVPCISGVGCGEPPEAWHWRFGESSVRALLGDVFAPDALELEVYGNVLAAAAFLYGLAAEELTREELDHVDPNYPLVIAASAVR